MSTDGRKYAGRTHTCSACGRAVPSRGKDRGLWCHWAGDRNNIPCFCFECWANHAHADGTGAAWHLDPAAIKAHVEATIRRGGT